MILSDTFCDYLDVTFAPDDCPYPAVNRLLLDIGYSVDGDGCKNFVYRPPGDFRGSLKIQHCSTWARISASGGACAHLRALGVWLDYLSLLSAQPHRVTRLDAARDYALDGADVIASLQARYPAGEVRLSRKAMRVTTLLSVRGDGRSTGTYYVGKSTRARLTAKVYDKAHQLFEIYGQVHSGPWTRFEITARGDYGATLRDAALPDTIFWHAASPALLTAPEGVPMWLPNSDFEWQSPPRDFNAATVLQRRVERLAELEALAVLSDDLGPNGRAYLLRLVKERLEGVTSAAVVAPAVAAARVA